MFMRSMHNQKHFSKNTVVVFKSTFPTKNGRQINNSTLAQTIKQNKIEIVSRSKIPGTVCTILFTKQ